MQAVVERTGVNPAEVGDIVIGSVLAPGAQRANECRMAAFFAGFPGGVLSLGQIFRVATAVCSADEYMPCSSHTGINNLRSFLSE